jgi:hypothetical protein
MKVVEYPVFEDDLFLRTKKAKKKFSLLYMMMHCAEQKINT